MRTVQRCSARRHTRAGAHRLVSALTDDAVSAGELPLAIGASKELAWAAAEADVVGALGSALESDRDVENSAEPLLVKQPNG